MEVVDCIVALTVSEERGFPPDEAVPVGLVAGVDKCVVVCSGRW